jgi:hypothetical protein
MKAHRLSRGQFNLAHVDVAEPTAVEHDDEQSADAVDVAVLPNSAP